MASKQHPVITKKNTSSSVSMADFASWYCVIFVLALILLSALKETNSLNRSRSSRYGGNNGDDEAVMMVKGNQVLEKGCDEIYVVGEGETLHSISVKCGDPFIVEQNPHIHDPDDVFPGLVIKITTTIPPPPNHIS
ncbi:uncharacterized protein LOC107432657 [Ziziphus jujuba]|uniref:Uncharacterized protein LOC107432657 n=1 Tax=Ziziphus jujuba TaxID=326968 RepID=A0A6P4ARQ2_ZIZJJ|nr:uncharacterized protein LOC107432657 [Ziziphus jujuba]